MVTDIRYCVRQLGEVLNAKWYTWLEEAPTQYISEHLTVTDGLSCNYTMVSDTTLFLEERVGAWQFLLWFFTLKHNF